MKKSGKLTETLLFGRAGVDDLRIDPAAVSRLMESGHYTMLVEGEDQPKQGEEWPHFPGDRIVFSSFDEQEPLAVAIVSEEYVGAPAVLADIAGQNNDDNGTIAVQTTYDETAPFPRPGHRSSLWDVAVLVSRLIGIYVVLRLALGLGPQGIAAFFSQQGPDRWIALLFLLALLAVAAGLWVKAPALADRLVYRSKRASPEIPISPVGLQSLFFSSLGVFFIATAVPSLVGAIAHFVTDLMTENSWQKLPVSFPVGQLFGEASRLILGLLLIAGSKKIAERFRG